MPTETQTLQKRTRGKSAAAIAPGTNEVDNINDGGDADIDPGALASASNLKVLVSFYPQCRI